MGGSERRGGVSKFCHYDALGSTRGITNSSQTATDSILYDGLGMTVSRTSSTPAASRYRPHPPVHRGCQLRAPFKILETVYEAPLRRRYVRFTEPIFQSAVSGGPPGFAAGRLPHPFLRGGSGFRWGRASCFPSPPLASAIRGRP